MYLRLMSMVFYLASFSNSQAQVSIISSSAQSSNTFSYSANSGANRLLLVLVSAEYNGSNSVSSITWGNKSLTAIGTVSLGPFTYNHTSAFYLQESDIANVSGNTLNVYSAAGNSSIRSISVKTILLRNVLQSVPISEVISSANYFVTGISLGSSISSDNGDMVFATSTSDRNNLIFSPTGSGFSELFDLQLANLSTSVSYRPITSSMTHSSPGFNGNQFSVQLTMLGFEVNSTLDPLPVSFLGFKVWETQEDVSLEWKIASELNNDYFKLETSIDNASWITLALVPSEGNTNEPRTYSYHSYVKSHASYFRLSQIDLDGSENILSTYYLKRNYYGFSSPNILLEQGDCKAINLNGQVIANCKECTASGFISTTFSIAPLFVLEMSRQNEIIFKGIIATEGR